MPKPTLTSAVCAINPQSPGCRKLGLESDICGRQGVYCRALFTPAWEYHDGYRIQHCEAAGWWGVHLTRSHILAHVGTWPACGIRGIPGGAGGSGG